MVRYSTAEAERLEALRLYGALDSQRERPFDAITSLVKDLLGVPICAVSLVGEDRQWFKSVQGLDLVETPRSVAFCHHTIGGITPMVVADARNDIRFADNPLVTGDPHLRSYAGAPLITPEGHNLGALCVIDREPRSFTDDQLGLLQRFAGLVIEQLALKRQAHRDFLTGVLTRRAFVETAERSLRLIEAEGGHATLLLVDLDHFKLVNDRFGHPVGDRVLRGVAQHVGERLQPADLFGRMGGEEFGVLLHGLAGAAAISSAERVRQAVAGWSEAGCPPVTASIGLAGLARPTQLSDAFSRADVALYQAKRSGRNRCVPADGVEHRSAA